MASTVLWRRGRDSNPRYGCPYAAFRVRCIQPLCHLSELSDINSLTAISRRTFWQLVRSWTQLGPNLPAAAWPVEEQAASPCETQTASVCLCLFREGSPAGDRKS